MQLNIYIYALIAAALFIVLSPGVLVTLPPTKDCGAFGQIYKAENRKCATSIVAVLVHGIVFLVAFAGFIFFRKGKDF